MHSHRPRLPPGVRRHVRPLVGVREAVLRGDPGAEGGLPGDTHRGGWEQVGPDLHAQGDPHRGCFRVGVLRTAKIKVR